MTSELHDVHLTEEDILRTIVDESDLPNQLREHLSRCPLCRAEKRRIELPLSRLSEMVEHHTPAPVRKVQIPVSKEQRPRTWFGMWQGAVVTGTVALILILLFGTMLWKPSTQNATSVLQLEMIEDERLLDEISSLDDNELPQPYLDISGGSDFSPDDDFFEFIDPTSESRVVS